VEVRLFTYAVAGPDDQNDTGGVGYQVDLTALSAAAAAAMSISQDVNVLADLVAPANSMGAQGGLQIGVAIDRAESSWRPKPRWLRT
jgi:hypothetical protein